MSWKYGESTLRLACAQLTNSVLRSFRRQMEGLSENIRKSLNEIIEKNLISEEELKNRIFGCIKGLSENEALHVLDSFIGSDLESVGNKENYLYELFLDHLNTVQKPENLVIKFTENIKDISDKNLINQLLNRTKYTLTLSSGQRRYGGPPPHWDGPPPGTGEIKFCSQVHIGKLGKNMFEDTLVPLLESCGRIYQLRTMVNPTTGENKGYAFADFFTKEEAEQFIKTYDNKQIEPNITLSAKLSIPNCRIFVGGFPSFKTKEEVEKELKTLFPEAEDVKAFATTGDKRRNRGYAFITFSNHNDASQARKKLQIGKTMVFNQIIRDADWAEQTEEDDGQKRPTILFIRYNGPAISADKLRPMYQDFGEIKRLDSLNDYAFIEFEDETAAEKAVSETNGKEIDETILEVSFAKSGKLHGKRKRRYEHMNNRSYPSHGKSPNPRHRHHFNDRRDRYNYPPPSYRDADNYYHEPRYRHDPYRRHHASPPLEYRYREPPHRYPPPPPYNHHHAPPNDRPIPGWCPPPPPPARHELERSYMRNDRQNPKNINWGHGTTPHMGETAPHMIPPPLVPQPVYNNAPASFDSQYMAPQNVPMYNSQTVRVETNPAVISYDHNVYRPPVRPPGHPNFW